MPASLSEAVRTVLTASVQPLSPAQIRDQIRTSFPHLYQTEAHRVGIERGNYQSFDHALLNPIYALVTRSDDFLVDRSNRPMLISLAGEEVSDETSLENYESEVGLVYVLDTGLFTESGKKIVKIGHTTQLLSSRIAQLYTTGTPFQFVELHRWSTRNYIELEQAMHRLFAPFRINRSREFFTEEVLQHVKTVAEIHANIQGTHVAT